MSTLSNTRRQFLSAAAATAAVSAAEGPKAPLLPTVKFGKTEVTRLIVGTNPFMGYSHFNGILDRFMRDWYTEDRRAEVLHNCERAGINTWQLHYHKDTITMLERHRAEGGKLNTFLLSDFEMHKDFSMIPGLAKLGFIGMAHHGNRTDEAFRAKDMSRVHEFTRRVRDTGAMVGVSTHNPEVVDWIESAGWDLDYYMTCMYRVSRTADEARALLGGERPLGETFLEKDPERMTAVVRKTRRPCLAFKVMGAGRNGWAPEQVEAAFRFAYRNIKPSDAVIIGMCPRFKDEIAENTSIVRKIHSLAT
jgi:hypothetical protein